MAHELDNRVVLISGGAKGQGAEHARLLAARGARVVIGDISDDEGGQLADELGEAALYVHLDVREQQQWRAAADAAADRFGTLDGLVNNAGVLSIGWAADLPLEQYLHTVEVNQTGTFLGMQAVIPHLRRAGGGTVVNIASTAGLAGDRGLIAYAASKFAVVGMTKVAAMELGVESIRVNAVCPGVVHSDMTSSFRSETMAQLAAQLPLRRFGAPGDVASVVAFLTSDDSAYMTGETVVVDGGRLAGVLPPR
ncbi:glucose 1-dehydrogenase [Streptomyces tremellae]|uniref:Glucose 1-dehydrogenase n=1 Tax=Streptomyces tremellae TaxID=1124239 RepID=A0ABP7EWN5_9ACTN